VMRQDTTSSQTALRAVLNWLFRGTRVYLLSEPSRILKQRQIHWNRQTVDLEDEAGTVFYDVPWDSVEFWDDVEFHLPGDE